MSLWLLSQSLPPLCRSSTVEVQRWSKRCHGQCLREQEERLNKNLAFKLVRAFLGLLGMVLTSLCGGLAGFLLG